MHDPQSEVRLIGSNGEYFPVLGGEDDSTASIESEWLPFGFECVSSEEVPATSGLDIIRADYEGYPVHDDGYVESVSRPANCFPADSPFWENITSIPSSPHSV